MCLAVPGKIVAIHDDQATIDYGVEKRIAKLLDGEYAVGEYAIVQGGFVVQKIPAKEAQESLKLYQQACGGGS